VLSRDILFKPEVVCNSRNDKLQTEGMCPTIHEAPTEASDLLQNYKIDDGNIASTSGGSNVSNSEIHLQDRKRIPQKKQSNLMSSGEFVCPGGYSVRRISYYETIQSNERKQWLKALKEEFASMKEN